LNRELLSQYNNEDNAEDAKQEPKAKRGGEWIWIVTQTEEKKFSNCYLAKRDNDVRWMVW